MPKIIDHDAKPTSEETVIQQTAGSKPGLFDNLRKKFGRIFSGRNETNRVDLITDIASAIQHQETSRVLELISLLPYPSVFKRIYEESPVFFCWMVDRKLLDKDPLSLLESYSLSPELTEAVLAAGFESQDAPNVVQNLMRVGPAWKTILELHSPVLTQEIAEEDLLGLIASIKMSRDCTGLLLKDGYSGSEIKQSLEILIQVDVVSLFMRYHTSDAQFASETDKFFKMLANFPQQTVRMMEYGLPFSEFATLLEFENNVPHPNDVTLITHAMRMEHYAKMISVSEDRGAQTGFQLRSKEENNLLGIGVISYGRNGQGGEYQPGEAFVSTTVNSIAGLYGDVVFIGRAAALLSSNNHFRARDFSLTQGLYGMAGELSVFTPSGRAIEARELLSKASELLEKGDQEEAQNALHRVRLRLGINLKSSDTALNEQITSLSQLIERQLSNPKPEGIKVLSSDFKCLVPADQLSEIEQMIEQSTLSDEVKQQLSAQLIPYSNSLSRELIESFKSESEWPGASDLDELTLQHPLVSERGSFDHFSVIPSVDVSILHESDDIPTLFTATRCCTMMNSLSRHAEWSYLRMLPRETWGLMHRPFLLLLREAASGVYDDKSDWEKDNEISEILLAQGSEIGTALKSLSAERQQFYAEVFELTGESFEEKSVFELWRQKYFPEKQ